MKHSTKILSLAHIALWCVIFIASIIEYFTYNSTPETESLDAFMTKGIYSVLILFSLIGVAQALLTHFTLRKYAKTENKDLKQISLLSLVLFYMSLIFVFISRETIFLFVLLLVWLVSVITQLILLFKKAKEAKTE